MLYIPHSPVRLMTINSLTPHRTLLLAISLIGFVLINIPFLYFAIFDTATYEAGMSNGLALVFIGEAFLLMLLLAYLIRVLGLNKPGWITFIILSIVGSMAFSVPFYLYLISDPKRHNTGSD